MGLVANETLFDYARSGGRYNLRRSAPRRTASVDCRAPLR